MIYFRSKNKQRQQGASMVEFALAFPLIMLMIVFLVDAGLYLFQRALLTDGTASMNRQIVAKLGQREALIHQTPPDPAATPPSCTNLLNTAKPVRKKLMAEHPVLYKGMTFTLDIREFPPVPYRLLTLEGALEFRCITCKFFQSLLGKDLALKHSSALVIERPPFTDRCPKSEPSAPDYYGPKCIMGDGPTFIEADCPLSF